MRVTILETQPSAGKIDESDCSAEGTKMKLKTQLMMFTAAIAFSATVAQASITATDVAKTYQDGAYTNIEIVDGPTQIKVEAIKDGVKIEVIYDKTSGSVISSEQHTVTGDQVGTTGVEVTTSDTDFGESQDATDDSAGDDHGGDTAGTDDGAGHDVGDDHGGDTAGSDDGAGHDAGDDNGGSDNDSGNDGSGDN